MKIGRSSGRCNRPICPIRPVNRPIGIQFWDMSAENPAGIDGNLENKAWTPELRAVKPELRAAKPEFRATKLEFRAVKPEFRASNQVLKG